MYYIIFAKDKQDSLALRETAIAEHRARIMDLRKQGRLLTAGPMPLIDADDITAGVFGSCIIAEFASLTEAKNWANQDPLSKVGVYQKITVKPYKIVF